MALGKMKHEVDPREEIIRQLPDLKHVEVFNNMVLVAVYERPDKTASGIILTGNTKDEDKYQGKAALIIKLGPIANEANASRGGELAGQLPRRGSGAHGAGRYQPDRPGAGRGHA
jgi:hypothetical protein